ncbi:Hypothetical predicted protein [Mytilus galloprovincialis]|uniref:Uncharacterized protein n=1 Tax=Mytilus galloprovincialis TaxID=29158 RepID=A0A8B6FS89_MYTGA|nr:Hypothetical predicted protein [Mytilus galloprovincialis]
MQPKNAVIMDLSIVEEIHVQPENQPPPPAPVQNQPPPSPPVENQPPVLQFKPLVPVQPRPVQCRDGRMGSNVSEQFLVKLAYRGLKPQIQQIVVPQNPVSMSDLLSKSITAEMTINIVQPQQSSVENSILKATSSIEDKFLKD